MSILFWEIETTSDASDYARENGFRYVRARIGVGIYKDREKRTLEIGNDWCALYAAGSEPKSIRLCARRRLAEAAS